MKLINANPAKKLITVESTPFVFTVANAIVVAATSAAAAWIAHQGMKEAFGMDKITFDYNDRIEAQEEPDFE